ncbi:MAG: agmatinase [SAR324 cluster bacterium]|nr:agmatinase [SAR324 cluster bacterium]
MKEFKDLSSFTPMYTKAMSFAHLELVTKLKDAQIVLLGVPFDSAVSNRPGTRLAPRAIRLASTMIESENPYNFAKVNIPNKRKAVDLGDLVLDYASPKTIYQQISTNINPIISQGKSTIALGGDHSISYAFIKEYSKQLNQPISLLQFDSHTDTWSDEGLSRIDHGSMFYHAIKEGYIDPKKSVQLGIRTVNDDVMGVNIFDNDYIHQQGIYETIKRTLEIIGTNPVYLTFDIDFLDPAFAPGTGTPVCGGFSPWQAQQMLIGLAGLNFCGADLVEVSPPFDNSEITALCGATLIAYILKLMQARP